MVTRDLGRLIYICHAARSAVVNRDIPHGDPPRLQARRPPFRQEQPRLPGSRETKRRPEPPHSLPALASQLASRPRLPTFFSRFPDLGLAWVMRVAGAHRSRVEAVRRKMGGLMGAGDVLRHLALVLMVVAKETRGRLMPLFCADWNHAAGNPRRGPAMHLRNKRSRKCSNGRTSIMSDVFLVDAPLWCLTNRDISQPVLAQTCLLQRHSLSHFLAPSAPPIRQDTQVPEGVIRSRRKHAVPFPVSASRPPRRDTSERARGISWGFRTRKYLFVSSSPEIPRCALGATRYLFPPGPRSRASG